MQRSRSYRPSAEGGRRLASGVSAAAALLFALTLILTAAAGAGPTRSIWDPVATPTWTGQINGTGTSWDAATAVLADSTGAWVAGWAGNAAGNWDATLQRYSIRGVPKWASPRRYDGAAHKNDLIWKLAKGPNGSVYGAGTTMAADNKTNLLVIKWSKSGSRLWARTYDGPAHGNDAATALGVDAYGNVIVAGSSKGSHGLDYIVVKWSSAGVRRWAWRYDGSAHQDDGATDILVAKSGIAYVTGHIKYADAPWVKDAAFTVKLSATGTRVWSKSYLGVSGLGAKASSMVGRPAGGVYVAGWSLHPVTDKDAMVVRYSATGSRRLLPPPITSRSDEDSLADIAVTSNKRVVAVGSLTHGGQTDPYELTWATEADAAGEYIRGGSLDDAFTAVTTDSCGGIYFTGYMQTAADQAQIVTWRQTTLDPLSGFRGLWPVAPLGLDVPAAVASNGTRAYVVGWTFTATEGINQVILAYTH